MEGAARQSRTQHSPLRTVQGGGREAGRPRAGLWGARERPEARCPNVQFTSVFPFGVHGGPRALPSLLRWRRRGPRGAFLPSSSTAGQGRCPARVMSALSRHRHLRTKGVRVPKSRAARRPSPSLPRGDAGREEGGDPKEPRKLASVPPSRGEGSEFRATVMVTERRLQVAAGLELGTLRAASAVFPGLGAPRPI